MANPQTPRQPLALACSCAGLVLACSATSERPDHDLDAGPLDGGSADASRPDGGALDGGSAMPTPVPTTITLENVGSAPFVVGNQCGGNFLSLRRGEEELAFDRSCACACDAPTPCGCPAFCAITQQLVVPGKSASVEWDGLYARFDEPACYELSGLKRGETVTAEACWNESPEGIALECQDVDFAYDTERDVTIEAHHDSAARTPVRIVLENQSAGPIEIVTDLCGAQAWFALDLGDQPASLSAFCPCPCSGGLDFELGSCPVCGGCADTVRESLAQGETSTFDWDGMFFYTYDSGCSARYAMPAGTLVHAQICWTRSGASDPTCQPFRFVLGESAEVRATAQ